MTAAAPLQRGVYLGVDMGGSGTRACLLSEPLEPQRWTVRGGNLAIDPDSATEILCRLVAEARPEAVCLGLAGARTAPEATAQLAARLAPLAGRVTIMTDGAVALASAFGPGDDGIVVSAGTGTVATVRHLGEIYVLGGHGYLFGDRGGGFDIGRRLISEALRARDLDQAGSDDLVTMVESLIGVPLDAFKANTYRDFGTRTAVAGLAARLKEVRHPVRERIISDAAAALVELAVDAQTRFGQLPVRIMGGVFEIPEVAEAMRTSVGGQPVTATPSVVAAEIAASS